MKKLLVYALLTCSLAAYFLFHPYETVSFVLPKQTQFSYPATKKKPSLKLYAKAACITDAKTGRVLYGKDEDTPLPMASTTKIMTCILSLEKGKDDTIVTFSKNAASKPKVKLGASAGSKFYLKDLRYSLMLMSQNDTAVAIAESLAGTTEAFAKWMNQKASKLHMKKTHFVTPNGLDGGNHQSSAKDMCLLANYAIQNKRFLSIIQTSSHSFTSINKKNQYSVANKDAFLTQYAGAIGVKTGFTNKAGYCFVGAASRNGITFSSTVLGSGWPPKKQYKWADTKNLMDFAFSNYKINTLPPEDFSYVRLPVENGLVDSVGILTPTPPQYLLSDFDNVMVRYNIPSVLRAPISRGSVIGSVQYCVNGHILSSMPLYPSEDVKAMSFLYRLTHIWEHWMV